MADLNNHLRISFDMMQFSIGEIENIQKAQNAVQDKTNKTYKETHKSTGEREQNCVVSMCEVLWMCEFEHNLDSLAHSALKTKSVSVVGWQNGQ